MAHNNTIKLFSANHNIDHKSFLYLYTVDDKVGTPIYAILGVGSFILVLSIVGLVLLIRKKRNAKLYTEDKQEKGYSL